jgi:hypothetical protein
MLETNYCTHYGESVGEIKGIVDETRQMIDIPLPIAELRTYNVIEKSCKCCGMKLRGTFPKGVNAPVFYGLNIQTMAACLRGSACTGKTSDRINERLLWYLYEYWNRM